MYEYFIGYCTHFSVTKMPFFLSIETRDIIEIFSLPPGEWENVIINCQALSNFHPHAIEWEYRPAYGLRNKAGDLILPDRDMAYDVEYYYRGADEFKCLPGFPGSVKFS